MWEALASPAFDSVRPWCARVAELATWPTVAELDTVLRDRLALPEPVSLEPQPKKKSRRRPPIARDSLYEARIHLARRIPTRERSMHDLANALVWAAFPCAKRALAARQYTALAARVPPIAERLPGARTREQDLLAMLDEGGVLLLGKLPPLVFGHALLEHVAERRVPDVRALAVVLPLDHSAPATLEAHRDRADAALAALLDADRLPDTRSIPLDAAC